MPSSPPLPSYNLAPALQAKLDYIATELKALGSALVAFSGGVDSSLLAALAYRNLGDDALALTALSPTLAQSERQQALLIAQDIGIRHELCESHETDNPDFLRNDAFRCYHCKSELFSICQRFARERGFAAVLDGTNLDDLGEHRPGKQAGDENEVRSLFVEAGLHKAEIREASKALGLRTWRKPELACLSSRFPTGFAITLPALAIVDACEDALRSFGFEQVRARIHDLEIRIELEPAEISRATEASMHQKIVAACQKAGAEKVTIDPKGYRRGSGNALDN